MSRQFQPTFYEYIQWSGPRSFLSGDPCVKYANHGSGHMYFEQALTLRAADCTEENITAHFFTELLNFYWRMEAHLFTGKYVGGGIYVNQYQQDDEFFNYLK